VFVNVELPDVKARTPFESAWADAYEVPYNETGNGSGIAVRQSSHALPVFVVAGVKIAACVLKV